MKEIKKNVNECGPFIACGAAAVNLNHQPGEPTNIDRLVAAIKGFSLPRITMRKSQGAVSDRGCTMAHTSML